MMTIHDRNKYDAFVDTLKRRLANNDFEWFNTIIPRPESQADDWYDWNVENWGTKCDAYDFGEPDFDDNTNTILLTFYTAWSPPIPIFEKLAQDGWVISAKYIDEGYGFIGQYNNEHSNLSYDIDDAPYDLLDEFDVETEYDEEVITIMPLFSHEEIE